MKATWSYMLLPFAVVIGGYWLFIKVLTNWPKDTWWSRVWEEAESSRDLIGARPELNVGSQPAGPSDLSGYPEGTRWVTVPVELQGSAVWPAPMLPGTEDWWDINYPGWTYA